MTSYWSRRQFLAAALVIHWACLLDSKPAMSSPTWRCVRAGKRRHGIPAR